MTSFLCWPCNFCNQGFGSLIEVNRHEERFHQDRIVKTIKELEKQDDLTPDGVAFIL